MAVAVVVSGCVALVEWVLRMVKVLGGGWEVVVWAAWFWCSPLVVVGYYACLLSARAHTAVPLCSECRRCQSRSCSLSHHGLKGHTSSSRWATSHIEGKSIVVLSSPCPQNGPEREVG